MKKLSYTARKAMYGRGFIALWVLGVLFFFIVPFIKTVWYSFNDITSGFDGLLLTPVGFDKYVQLFRKDAEFMPKLSSMLVELLYQVPLVVAFALLVAVILNRQFPGRTLFRAIFFLPVIVLSGSIMILFKSDELAVALFASDSAGAELFDNITMIKDLLASLGIGEAMLGVLQKIVGMVVDVCWACGVQYLLCLAALQGIPSSLYEAARVEGATKWEEFWKITYPMTRPTLFLCVIYTIVANTRNSGVIEYVKTQAFTKFDYGYASAIAMVDLLVVLAVVGLVAFLLRKWYRNA